MENSISEGNKRICFDSSWESLREKQQLLLSAEVIADQPISDDYVYGERGIDERDDPALNDSSPGRREGRTWKPSSTVNRVAWIRKLDPASATDLRY